MSRRITPKTILSWLRSAGIILCALMVVSGSPTTYAAISEHDENSLLDESTFYDIVPLGACGDPNSDATALTGSDNVTKAYNYFVSKGLTGQQAAGILGNFLQESGVNPKTHQGHKNLGDYPVNGVGFGIAQWTFGGRTSGRQGGLVKLAESKNVKPNTLAVQLEYVMQEFNNGFKKAFNNLKATTTPSDAAYVFHRDYEISADSRSEIKERLDDAEAVFARLGGTTQAAASDSSADGTISEACTSGGTATGDCKVTVNKSSVVVGAMQGTASILSCARLFDPYGYKFGGAHSAPSSWIKSYWAPRGGFDNKRFVNIVDCSSIVMLGIYLAFGVSTQFTTDSISSNKNFKRISSSDVKPGDIMVRSGHMEIATNARGTKTFGAHTANTAATKQISDSGGQVWTSTYRYIGRGAE